MGLRIVILILSGFVAIALSHTLSPISESRQLYFAPPPSIKYFSFGFSEVLADTLWLRVIQDFDLCEQAMRIEGEAKLGKNRSANCKKGWVYHLLDVVVELAPRFRMPAAVGPLMLSVVVDDREGATLLFEKAVRNFPEDWSILFRAAYHNLYEEENFQRAAELFAEAGRYGAPSWVHSLAAKLYSQVGRDLVAKVVLEDYLRRTAQGTPGRDRVEKRLKEINARIRASKQEK